MWLAATSPEPAASVSSEVTEPSAPLSDVGGAPEINIKDEGRKPDLPQCPIIFVTGTYTSFYMLCLRHIHVICERWNLEGQGFKDF